jgi:hypothetical protein
MGKNGTTTTSRGRRVQPSRACQGCRRSVAAAACESQTLRPPSAASSTPCPFRQAVGKWAHLAGGCPGLCTHYWLCVTHTGLALAQLLPIRGRKHGAVVGLNTQKFILPVTDDPNFLPAGRRQNFLLFCNQLCSIHPGAIVADKTSILLILGRCSCSGREPL